jgi:GNAT superfamily N-acetyltransferase
MAIEVRAEPASTLATYAAVPIAFEVRERLAVVEAGLGGFVLALERVTPSYVKDYDADPENHPTAWARRFDVAGWGVLAAYTQTVRVGGAVIVWGTPGVNLLDGRSDLAVLWDVRVAPAHRGRGLGGALFRAAEEWAWARGAAWLKVETQNVNVPACRFYARQGCALGAVHRFAYPELPDETQLLWYKSLSRRPPSACEPRCGDGLASGPAA